MKSETNKENSETETKGLLQEFSAALDSVGSTGEADAYAAPVKTMPKHGVFIRWPEAGLEDFVHPEDVELATQVMPGSRIFEMDTCPLEADVLAGYRLLSYGDLSIRIKPAMWLRVKDIGYRVGDRVEVLSKNGTQQPVIGNLAEVSYNPIARQTEYRIEVNGMVLRKKFHQEDFRPCRKLGVPLGKRQRKKLNSASLFV